MRDILITNNDISMDAYKETCDVIYLDKDLLDVLKTIRDYVHKGHRLLSHPLSGSVKPNENPYKSVLVSAPQQGLDEDSLRIIENCIASAAKFPVKYTTISEEMRLDFKKVDFSLISSAFCNKI